METEGKDSRYYENGDFHNQSVISKEEDVKSNLLAEHGNNDPSLHILHVTYKLLMCCGAKMRNADINFSQKLRQRLKKLMV